jgi:hypothetical protein
MTDPLMIAVLPLLAMSAFAAVFGLFMAWLISKQHPKEPKGQAKPPHTMAQ